MKKYIDLRSDTVTQPTPAMRQAMLTAEVGDDIYRDDPTVRRLEELVATRLGKAAALLMVSGTMGNQVAIMSHTQLGDEIIAGAQSHIVHYECGAAARLSGVNYALVDNADSCIYPADIERLTRPHGDVHFPHSSLLCVESPLCNGRVVPLSLMQENYAKAHELGLAVHMDGARIFNGATSLGVDVRELAACADSVMLCLSKGLCAPVGSVLAGSSDFVDRARRMRKVLGGGMRQSGVLAACGIVAIDEMTKRLGDDHDNARYMARELAKLPDITCDEGAVEINMVFWQSTSPKFDSNRFASYMLEHGVKVSTGSVYNSHRYVTHNDITRADVDMVLGLMHEYITAL